MVITDEVKFPLPIEIRSVKADYRTEYRKMLEDITDECTELLMIHSSPVTQRFNIDYTCDPKTLYQRFAFIKSIIDSNEFRNAVQRVISMPTTAWSHRVEEIDIRRSKRIGSKQIRQMVSRNERINLPASHGLYAKMKTVPSHLTNEVKVDTVDTPENRFVKHALCEFQRFCGLVCRTIEKNVVASSNRPHIYNEAKSLEERFGEYLNHNMFREISVPTSLPLNSPVLQRKEGYRDILKVWLMFDLAAKLTWSELDDSYHAGKRDVATLYEYWLFFKLLRLVEDIFDIERTQTKQLVTETRDGLGLQLRAGNEFSVNGAYRTKGRHLSVKFSYNRTFGKSGYPKGGSWSQQMRPDYTLSIWPAAFKEAEAEAQEVIIHVHFDAKYKVDDLQYLIDDSESSDKNFLNDEKVDQKSGRYKRADLLKMHAYKDAIRRTVGAYVLYPGTKSIQNKGFHEIVPGLGAFPISPSNNAQDIDLLRNFINAVVDNFVDRTSHREESSFHTYNIHKEDSSNSPDSKVFEGFPEKDGDYRVKPVTNTTVLVGYYRSKEQLEWIQSKNKYNIRVDKSGLSRYGVAELGATYLLLYGKDQTDESPHLLRISKDSAKSMTRNDLINLGYPNPSQDNYLVFDIESKSDTDNFVDGKWDVKKLKESHHQRSYAPFSVTLKELMEVKLEP
jgi:predicted component of viral defense system (DUF524 family)